MCLTLISSPAAPRGMLLMLFILALRGHKCLTDQDCLRREALQGMRELAAAEIAVASAGPIARRSITMRLRTCSSG